MLVSKSLIEQLECLVGADAFTSIVFPAVQQMPKFSNLCGFFCIAWLLSIVIDGKWPESVQYSTLSLRQNTLRRLEMADKKERLIPFPVVFNVRAPNYTTGDLDCTQKQTDSQLMGLPAALVALDAYRAQESQISKQPSVYTWAKKR